MSLERLSKAHKKTVGSKQTLKAIERGQARMVYVARNAERSVTDPIIQASHARSIPVVIVETMNTLGRASGIEIGCASSAVLED